MFHSVRSTYPEILSAFDLHRASKEPYLPLTRIKGVESVSIVLSITYADGLNSTSIRVVITVTYLCIQQYQIRYRWVRIHIRSPPENAFSTFLSLYVLEPLQRWLPFSSGARTKSGFAVACNQSSWSWASADTSE